MKSFAELKTAAQNASSAVELFLIAKASNDKLLRNISKAKLMSYTQGRAADADHYFQNVIPGWTLINNEIHDLLRAVMDGKSADDRAAIITKAYEIEAAA